MDKLKRFIMGEDNPPGDGLPPQEAQGSAKEGGHGDHWGCIFRSVEQDELLNLVRSVVEGDNRPEGFEAKGGGAAYHAGGDPLRICVLVVGDNLQSAYPEAMSASRWPVTVREVVPWANGVEGQIAGTCRGAEISFFDTRFYANRHKYVVGREYNFQVSAFAYVVGPAPDNEVEIEAGAKVSLKGARAYMPANLGQNTGADIDEFWFHSPLEAAPTTAELAGKQLSALPVTLALPEDFEMRLPLYAAEHTMAPGTESVQPEADLEGYLWLQGYLSED